MEVALTSLVAALSLLTIIWLLSVWLRDAAIIDIVWGLGFVLIAWLIFARFGQQHPRGLLLCLLTTCWGLRLATYLFWRNAGKEEDYRYRAMREKHGANFWIVSLFTVFWLQAAVMWVVSFPIQFGQLGARSLGILDFVGAVLLLSVCSLSRLAIGSSPSSKAMKTIAAKSWTRGCGDTRGTRTTLATFAFGGGLFFIAAAGGAGWTIFSPLVMSFFLIKVSGVAMLESTIVERRPKYADYIRRTNAFFPGPPKG